MTNNLETNRRQNYPIRCIECGQVDVRPVVVARDVKRNQDGRVYELHVADLPVTRCDACGEIYFTAESDERITAALRDHLGLLTPAQIRDNLDSLGLSQKEAAERLGIAAETLSRWLTGGMVQSRAMDNLLRAFFDNPEVREKLTGNQQDRSFGARARIDTASHSASGKNVA